VDVGSIFSLLQPYGGWGVAGALVLGVFALIVRGDLVTKTMLTEVRANDKDTIETLKEGNAAFQQTLPEILKSLQSSEYALKEIQQAGKPQGGRRD